VDEGASTFGPSWANLFELARKGRFSLLFGAQSAGGLTDESLGLSEAFYERVMANVNLKVMMRVGDNRTAQDMAEWFGKVPTTKTSIGQGISSQTSGLVLAGPFDLAARESGGESRSVNVSEAEGYLVSPEELKHEMSSEKGLAWFDMGDGRIVKGRSLWVEAKTPSRWDGREHLMRFPIDKREAINLASYVNGQILKAEQSEVEPDSISEEELAFPARHSEDPSVREYPSMPNLIATRTVDSLLFLRTTRLLRRR
jgi:TraM recognition site of TraD and TraG